MPPADLPAFLARCREAIAKDAAERTSESGTALVVLAVNALPALLDAVEAGDRAANYMGHAPICRAPQGPCDCGYMEASAALDAALLKLTEVPRG